MTAPGGPATPPAGDAGARPRRYRLPEVLASSAAERARPVELAWTVRPPKAQAGQGKAQPDEEFDVDLTQLAYGWSRDAKMVRHARASRKPTGHRAGIRSVANEALTKAFAPTVQRWSRGKRMRTVQEALSQFKVFLEFVAEAEEHLRPDGGSPRGLLRAIAQLDGGVGIEYANWLRLRPYANARRSCVYATTKMFVELAVGGPAWLANPFSTDKPTDTDAAAERPEISDDEMRALVNLCKGVIRRFKARRRASLRARRPAQAARRGAAATAQEVARIRERLAGGESLTGAGAGWASTCVLPSADVVCAAYLLTLMRLGTNEQPLLDAKPGGWHAANPLDPTGALIVLLKNRAGKGGARTPRVLGLPAPRRPEYHAFRLMRYVSLLTEPVRAGIRNGLGNGGFENGQERRAASHLLGRFWLYVDAFGKPRDLNGANVSPTVEAFLERHRLSHPALARPDGTAVRYSAKAIRESYFRFALKAVRYDYRSGQRELQHGPDSNAILNYTRRPWARRYAKQRHRDWQEAAFSVLFDPERDLTPAALRGELKAGGKPGRNLAAPVPVPPKYRKNKVQHGLYCKDPAHPPPEVYVPSGEGDVCPAAACWDCVWARCFDESLAEMARDILNLRLLRSTGAAHLWMDSEAAEQLRKLEELFGRWPERKRNKAMAKAEAMDKPPLPFFSPGRR